MDLGKQKMKITYFLYDNNEIDSRGGRPITNLLGDFKWSIQSDGYVVYKHLVKQKPENEHLLCWAYVRAKFKYAQDYSKDSSATWFIDHKQTVYDRVRKRNAPPWSVRDKETSQSARHQ